MLDTNICYLHLSHEAPATMHRVKGLQFNYMFMPSLKANVFPLQSGLDHCADETAQQAFTTGERCLLHVAATRAKKQVFVSYYGQPSPLVTSSRR